jgi:competence protein ComEA
MEDTRELLNILLRKYWLPTLLALLALIFFGYGLISLLGTSSSPEVTFETNEKEDSVSEIVIDIEGSVANPGVYRLKEGSIVQDALIAAGGASEEADRDWMAKNMNLALTLKNGQKIYIPNEEEADTVSVIQTVEGSSTGLIDINTASMSELDSLSGVGPVTAEKIVKARPYASIDELLSKKIVGESVFEKIKDKITVQ